MGHRAQQDLGGQHPAPLEIVGKGGLALGEFGGIHLALRAAHHPGLGCLVLG